ncbi:MAG: two-component system response regulator [Deltaproteobacteria bacterium]|nr:two-component system response regulator [Deltaproteobacteria bacterium]
MAKQQKLNVLVVDRDEQTQVQLKDLLSEQGFGVTCLCEPMQAPEKIRQNRFQLVLLDVSPGSGGGEALAAIRALDRDVCVIATTGIASVEMAVETMKHSAFHYLQKPLDSEEVLLVVKEAIRDRGLLVDLETHLNAEVGRRIRAERHDSQLTLKQLANRTGLSVSLISQIELGKSAASMSTMHKLAAALGVKMGFFFDTL